MLKRTSGMPLSPSLMDMNSECLYFYETSDFLDWRNKREKDNEWMEGIEHGM